MSKPKILTGFSRYSDPDVLVKAKEINSHMANNVNFANPIPTLADLTVLITAFELSLANAASGSKLETSLKNQKRDLLEEGLTNLAFYVQANGKNDEAILLSSGFEMQKSKTPIGILPKPENFKVLPGNSVGSVKVSVNKITGADSYLFEYTDAPVTANSIWLVLPSSKSNNTISGLISGKQYAFKVTGVGSNPEQVFSDVVLSFVL